MTFNIDYSLKVKPSLAKGQLISECLFDFFKFSKKPTKNLTNFCPESEKWSNHEIKSPYTVRAPL